MLGERLVEKGWVPDSLIRIKIRSLLRERLKSLRGSDDEAFARSLEGQPIAVETRAANEQHYELPARFFELVLGPQRKYSCGLYEKGALSLAEAEEAMLALTAERAGLSDGQNILELGCGWGSLTLWMARRFPRSRITGISNSHAQRIFIDGLLSRENLDNVEILTRDMNVFETTRRYDRIVSVEMFEHMRNVPALLEKAARWLNEEGKLFLHIFTHARHSYLFEDGDDSDWMARHFFSGGMMPSQNLYRLFQKDLSLEKDWEISGLNYQRTAEDWLRNADANREKILDLFERVYGKGRGLLWLARWRIFFMSCAELWGFRRGQEWGVTHLLFGKRRVL